MRSRSLAQLLIDEKGEVSQRLVSQAIPYLQQHLYSLGPDRQFDGKRQEHILKVLRLLQSNKDLIRQLKKMSRPLSNKCAEDLIRHTLQLSPTAVVTDAHTRQAVLAAWLCYLRQNVGSCFATAPAKSLCMMNSRNFSPGYARSDAAMGRLKRTIGGVEDSVPMSASWGSGDLKNPYLFSSQVKEEILKYGHSPGFALQLLKRRDF